MTGAGDLTKRVLQFAVGAIAIYAIWSAFANAPPPIGDPVAATVAAGIAAIGLVGATLRWRR